jgi:group I intron endonuclease
MNVYVITNDVNGKRYVGKTTISIEARFRQHLKEARTHGTRILCRAIRKYGGEHFTVALLDTATSLDELKVKEIHWIKTLGTFGDEYNATPGGDGVGHVHSAETKAKLSAVRTQYFQEHPEAREQAAVYARQARLSDVGRSRKRQAMLGNQYSKGMTYTHTLEAREAIARANRGKIVSAETRFKGSLARRGKGTGASNAMASAENRAKVGASKVGRRLHRGPNGERKLYIPGTAPEGYACQ